ncbi:MAG: hypothetical protein ACLFWD_06805 [Anaerolineales bacterium]
MNRITLLLAMLLVTMLLAACNLPIATPVTSATATSTEINGMASQPTGTPTAQPDDPALAPGLVSGQLCYPSESIPPMTLYFLELNSDELTSLEHDSGEPAYSLELAAGEYYAFAFRRDVQMNAGGAYTDYIACGAKEGCGDQTLHAFEVPPGGEAADINICDWVISADNLPPVPQPTASVDELAPAPTATATAPPNGVSLSCDGTYQRVRIEDNGPDGITVLVDDWQDGSWMNVWSKTPADPFLQQVLEEVGWYQFGDCQKLIIVPIQNGDPRVTLDLTVHAWNGATMTQVYSNSGWYGSWSKVGDIIRTREASKLGSIDDGPLSACEWLTLEYTWDGTAFNQTGSNLEAVTNCEVSVTDHP